MNTDKTLDGQSLGFGAVVLNAISRNITAERAQDLIRNPHLVRLLIAGLLDDDLIDLLPALVQQQRTIYRIDHGGIGWVEGSNVATTYGDRRGYQLRKLIEVAGAKKLAFLKMERAKQLCDLVSRLKLEFRCTFVFEENGMIGMYHTDRNTGMITLETNIPLDDRREKESWHLFFFNESMKIDGSDICMIK